MMYAIKTLEFDQILEKVAYKAFSKHAKSTILITEPSFDFKFILNGLNQVEELKELITTFGKLPFKSDFDIFEVLKSLKILDYLKIPDFIQIKNLIEMSKQIEQYRSQIDYETIKYNIWFKSFKHLKSVLEAIDLIINEDQEIYDHASTALKTIRSDIKRKTRSLDKTLDACLIRYQSYLNESIIVMRQGRYVLPVKDSFKHKVKGVIHDMSASKQTVYIEPEDIRQITQDIEYLKQLEAAEVVKVLMGLTTKLRPYIDEIYLHLEALIELDILHAKAVYAMEIKAVKPVVNKEGIIHLIDARHPLIEPHMVVPIELTLNKNQNILMITGPNTGGKTVALKTTGLLTLMMQSGLLIPAKKESQLSVFKQVFADIGDAQSIAQSLSTFSSHLTNIKKMFDHLESPALILLDELGSGTDPNEGVVLAISIIDKLRTYPNNRMILTTHYSELKLYAYEHEEMLTASVAFDENTLKPLYKLQLGVAGSSHALSIADRLGLPKDIIDNAQHLLKGRQSNIAQSIEKLSKEQNILEREKEAFKAQRIELEKEIAVYQQKNKSFDNEKALMLEKIKERELKHYEKLKKEVLEMIDNLSKVDKLSTPEMAKLKGKLNQKSNKTPVNNLEPLSVGDHVYMEQYGQEGVVTEVKQDRFIVSVGLFELPFKRVDLRKIDPKPKKQAKDMPKYTCSNPSKAAQYELDLRGVRYEQVKDLMDKAIDDALLSNTPYIRVIHGFGTGAIRKAVHAYIKESSFIKSHRYGGEGEGLNGVTIITLA